jgi:NDP-sugar pyrophosphorylase family protein
MRPVTDKPKGLLPVGGRPLLAHQFEWLGHHGLTPVVLCLGYQGERVRAAFGDGSEFGVRIQYRIEEEPRGTAGAVRDAAAGLAEDFLVVYGDLIVSIDASAIMRAHRESGAAATLVVRPTDHPEDSDLADVDDEGRIRWIGRLEGAPRPVGERLGCCAVWALSRSLLSSVPGDRPWDFARDLFPAALKAGEAIRAFRVEGGVRDIGTPERYERFLSEGAA